MKHVFFYLTVIILISQPCWAARAKIDTISKDPYLSALVIDADSGKTLFEDNADTLIYPASVLKLMVLLVILEQIEQKTLGLEDMVQVSKEAAQMGGSQVYLDPKEQFSVDNLLYALMVQSANDAAVALAIHAAGSKEAFVELMNQKARELGMKATHFHSVHGLPPAEGQEVDSSTARDLSLLSRELAKKTEAYKYTGTTEHAFRDGTFIMRTHNHLLKKIDGCDGFKTGYFEAAGFSIIATAKRNGVRIIALVMGSRDRRVRDAKAAELLAKGFDLVPPKHKVEAVVSTSGKAPVTADDRRADKPKEEKISTPENSAAGFSGITLLIFGLGFATGFVSCALLVFYRNRNRRGKHGLIV